MERTDTKRDQQSDGGASISVTLSTRAVMLHYSRNHKLPCFISTTADETAQDSCQPVCVNLLPACKCQAVFFLNNNAFIRA